MDEGLDIVEISVVTTERAHEVTSNRMLTLQEQDFVVDSAHNPLLRADIPETLVVYVDFMERIPQNTRVTLLPTCKAWGLGERHGWITDHRKDKIWIRLAKSGKVFRVSLSEILVEGYPTLTQA